MPTIKELLQYVFEWLGKFNHYQYFTEELYRKLPNRKNIDEAEVKCAFLHCALYNKFHILSTPCGMGWFRMWDSDNEDTVLNYLKSFNDIFDDYNKWCLEQR